MSASKLCQAGPNVGKGACSAIYPSGVPLVAYLKHHDVLSAICLRQLRRSDAARPK